MVVDFFLVFANCLLIIGKLQPNQNVSLSEVILQRFQSQSQVFLK